MFCLLDRIGEHPVYTVDAKALYHGRETIAEMIVVIIRGDRFSDGEGAVAVLMVTVPPFLDGVMSSCFFS